MKRYREDKKEEKRNKKKDLMRKEKKYRYDKPEINK